MISISSLHVLHINYISRKTDILCTFRVFKSTTYNYIHECLDGLFKYDLELFICPRNKNITFINVKNKWYFGIQKIDPNFFSQNPTFLYHMFGKICTKSIPRHRSLEPTSIQLLTVILLIFLFATVDTTQLFFYNHYFNIFMQTCKNQDICQWNISEQLWFFSDHLSKANSFSHMHKIDYF